MINIKDYDPVLKELGTDYFIGELQYVPDIISWAKEAGRDLGEPHSPMKLIADSDDSLTMIVQDNIPDEILSDVIKNLSIRWSVKDNVTNFDEKFNSDKKKLAYCYLKEYARALEKTEGNELTEDEWVLDEMEYLGFFNE